MFLRHLFVALCFSVYATQLRAEENINIGYLEQIIPSPPILSNLDKTPENEGLAGAEVATKDNATTGQFLGHNYNLKSKIVEDGDDILSSAKSMLSDNSYLLINAPKQMIELIADLPEAQGALLFNVSSPDNDLRNNACRVNLLHTIPSRSMLTDALAQFSVKKRWNKWAVIHGVHEADMAYLTSLEQSAKKFGINTVATKEWAFDADMRRNASREVPLFTQDMPDHDMIILADELGDFGRYVMYNTWMPRPAAGTEGIVPSAWSFSVEQHGAAQLQSRFTKSQNRDMRPIDYAAWAAVRAIGEAVTRTNSSDVKTIRNYIFSDEYTLAGFKGRPLTFRKWNGQMRQPIPLSHSRAVVAMAPIEGYLHQRNELDTLGLDKQETSCSAFTQ